MFKRIISILLFILVIFTVGCTNKGKEELQGNMQSKERIDKSLVNVKERGRLIVGTDAPYGVLEFFDENGEIVGMEVDLAKEITSRIGVELELIDYDFDDIFTHVKSGKIDIAISGMTITAERSMEMLFSLPYLNAGQIIIVRKDEEGIMSMEDLLENKRIGVQEETTGMEEVLKYVDSSFVIPYKGFDTSPEGGILHDLENGEIDAIVTDYTGAIDFVRQNPSLKIVGEPFTEEFYGMPTKLGNKALMDEVNRILLEMREDRKLNEIIKTWMEPDDI